MVHQDALILDYFQGPHYGRGGSGNFKDRRKLTIIVAFSTARFSMTAVGRNGGIMYDTIKVEPR